MAGTIGIKIANGDFYPITGENVPGKKRLVLTTVHDGQESVQIDLYRSVSKSMLDSQYIGTLVVEDIRPKAKGEPSIELVLASDADGNIKADAYDLDAGGEHHVLSVSLKTLDTVNQEDDFPDFDLDRQEPQPSALYAQPEKDEERKFPWLIMVLATVFVIIAIAILWFFFLGGRDVLPFAFTRQTQEQTITQTPPPPVVQQVQPAPKPVEPPTPPKVETTPKVETPPPQAEIQPPVETPPPVIVAPVTPPPQRPRTETAVRKRPPAPVLSYKVPAVIPKNGVVYQIRWGDTLWDISEAFYRNPWLYPRIARYNNIRNPDLIIAGSNVRIPPK